LAQAIEDPVQIGFGQSLEAASLYLALVAVLRVTSGSMDERFFHQMLRKKPDL